MWVRLKIHKSCVKRAQRETVNEGLQSAVFQARRQWSQIYSFLKAKARYWSAGCSWIVVSSGGGGGRRKVAWHWAWRFFCLKSHKKYVFKSPRRTNICQSELVSVRPNNRSKLHFSSPNRLIFNGSTPQQKSTSDISFVARMGVIVTRMHKFTINGKQIVNIGRKPSIIIHLSRHVENKYETVELDQSFAIATKLRVNLIKWMTFVSL